MILHGVRLVVDLRPGRKHWLEDYVFVDVYFCVNQEKEWRYYTTEEINLNERNEFMEALGVNMETLRGFEGVV